jgi:hypothetical protein
MYISLRTAQAFLNLEKSNNFRGFQISVEMSKDH